MRFPKETCAKVYDSAPGSVTIRWPAGEEPQKGRVYYLQVEEDAKEQEAKRQRRREETPETHADVMAGMKERFYGRKVARKHKRRRRPSRRPGKGDPCILVLGVEILERGWEATVVLYENPDPVRHLRIPAHVPAGPNPIDRFQEKPALEPEQIITPQSRREREDAEEALKVEHAASQDRAALGRHERRVKELQRRGRPTNLAQQALQRAKRRVDQQSAAEAA